ncbi:MAG: B12-binding domain-containing radical SAM protein [Deltaproteobacteria bacterium]|nr:B12-binding domain-containing radical SAM protein [Deltaproteobacteria bacterium]
MKILLVQPKSTGYMGQVSKSGKASLARVTLTTIAALTPPPHEVVIHDARLSEPDYDEDWDLVGFTGMTCEIPHAYRMADEFRRRGKTVVIGGYHATALPEEAAQHADIVVVGEAEGLWPRILLELANGGAQQTIYQNDKLIEMRDMAIPRRELLNPDMYTVFNTIQATRGCPFNCVYCAVTKFFGRDFRCRPVAEVVAEIKSQPDKRWMFLDDNLIGQEKYAKELFRALIPLGINWGAQVSFELAKNAELMDLYAQAGGQFAFIGFESLSAPALKSVRKGFNRPEEYAQGIRQLHRRGITIMGSFMFGLDGDDLGVFKRTVDFVNATKIDLVLYHILTPFPGTKLYEEMDRQGRIHDRDWSHYDTGHSVIHPQGMTSEELQNGWYWAVRETYKLPNILRRIVRPEPGWKVRLVSNYSQFRKVSRYPQPLHPEKYSNPPLP